MNEEMSYLQLKLAEGEGYRVEFKEKLANIDREIVAFSNAAGGEIYLGVNDDCVINGIQITNQLLSQIQDIARNCDPSIQISLKKYKAEQVLAIIIKEGNNKPYKCKDGFFLRIGANSQKLKRDEIVQFVNDVGKIHFDEAINSRFKYPFDLSKTAIQYYLQLCNITHIATIEDILISLGLAKKNHAALQLTNAGVLFFAKNPQQFFPEAYVTAVRYQTNDRYSIIDKKDFIGSPISQIEESLAFVQRHMNVAVGFNNANIGSRQDIYDYPPIAIREAIINAITHRDYLYDGSHIYIHMYPDHIDIENPGGLYHGLTLNDLGKRSIRRNRLIADLLHRARYIERVGSGFDRMKHSLSENNNPELQVSATNFFNITFYRRQQQHNFPQLSLRQSSLYRYFLERKTLTKKEVASMLSTSEDTAVRELKAMIQFGLIIKQGTGKATKYILNSKSVGP